MSKRKAETEEGEIVDSEIESASETEEEVKDASDVFWDTYKEDQYAACVSFTAVTPITNENLREFDAFYNRHSKLWDVKFIDEAAKNSSVVERDIQMLPETLLKLIELNALAMEDSHDKAAQTSDGSYSWRRPWNKYNFIVDCKSVRLNKDDEWSDSSQENYRREKINMMLKYVSLVNDICKDDFLQSCIKPVSPACIIRQLKP